MNEDQGIDEMYEDQHDIDIYQEDEPFVDKYEMPFIGDDWDY